MQQSPPLHMLQQNVLNMIPLFTELIFCLLCHLRGVVVGVDVNPSIGSVVLSQDRHRLGWNVGQKLPSRTLEASLQANVQFAPRDRDDNRDSFCVGLNTYASVSGTVGNDCIVLYCIVFMVKLYFNSENNLK